MPERVTTAEVSDVALPGAGTLALITLAAADGGSRPLTLGPAGLASLGAAVGDVGRRVAVGEIQAVAVTGAGKRFLAGADLTVASDIRREEQGRDLARAGQEVFGALADLPCPTVAFIGGAALGGGLELALTCAARTTAADAAPLGLPEVALGLIPGWGGCYALPHLVGPRRAIEVIVDNPLHGNRLLTAGQALAAGLVDAVLEPDHFLEASLAWTAALVRGEVALDRPTATDDEWTEAVAAGRARVAARTHGHVPAPDIALDLVEAARIATRREAYAAQESALARLLVSDELRAGLYAWGLTTHRARRPAGVPPEDLARPVASVGVVGAGLMAGQLALVLARRLGVPVTMRELDAARAAQGLARVRSDIERLATTGRIDADEADRIRTLVTSTTDLAALADADLVIEAVYEDLDVKRAVFAELETVVGPTTVLATNTSALSVTAMADGLRHPERVVGMHFFNPVAQMPLVEVVRTEHAGEAAVATASAVVDRLGKRAIAVRDAPGFVVNRLLVRLLGEVLRALEEGTSVEVADEALWPMALPMGPFQLLQLVGPAVAAHVLAELRDGLGDRFPHSPGLDRMVADGQPFVTFERRPEASSPVHPDVARYFPAGADGRVGDLRVEGQGAGLDRAGLLRRVQDALAQEAGLMIAEGVVSGPEDLDLAMILGAGWPNHLGGITPYLDRVGASERVNGRRFHD